jgi:hypothetical protein
VEGGCIHQNDADAEKRKTIEVRRAHGRSFLSTIEPAAGAGRIATLRPGYRTEITYVRCIRRPFGKMISIVVESGPK